MITLNRNLATRLSAQKIFVKLLENNQKELDFTGVELVSRSFANEFYKLEKKHNFYVKKKNLNKDLLSIFDNAGKVLDSNILKRNKFTTVSVEKYDYLI